MIIDGHAHVYAEQSAGKIVSSFTELHHMEPTSWINWADDRKMILTRLYHAILLHFSKFL